MVRRSKSLGRRKLGGSHMQIKDIVNHYITAAQIQVQNQKEIKKVEDMTESRLMEYNQQQFREMQRWLAYIMMMQFFARENMWSLLNQMKIQRTIDLQA